MQESDRAKSRPPRLGGRVTARAIATRTSALAAVKSLVAGARRDIMSESEIEDHEFPFRGGWGAIFACIGIFGLFSVLLVAYRFAKAHDLPAGASTGPAAGVFRLIDGVDSLFLTIALCFCLAFVALSVLALFVKLVNPQTLLFARDGVHIPGWAWSRRRTFIGYADIHSLTREQIGRILFLKICHAGGKREVAAMRLASREAFDDFCRELQERVPAVPLTSALPR